MLTPVLVCHHLPLQARSCVTGGNQPLRPNVSLTYGTNYHQAAVRETKTAAWALADAKAKRQQASSALEAAMAALEEATAALETIERAADAAVAAAVGDEEAANAAADVMAAQGDEAVRELEAARAEAARVEAATRATMARTEATIESDGLSNAIQRADVMLVEHHGKGGCDAERNKLRFAINNAITQGLMIDPDTRELCLYLSDRSH